MKKSNSDKSSLFFSLTWDFLSEYLPNRIARSADTIESYRDSLTLFRRFLSEHKQMSIGKFKFSDCTKDCIFDFRDYLQQNGNKPSTINVRITAIRAYLYYAADKDISIQSIALLISKIPPLRTIKEEKAILSEEALEAILAAPPQTKIGIRDRAILIMLYDSAGRIDEILSVKLQDLTLDGKYPCVLFHGKGSKERRTQISKSSIGHLKQYLHVYHSCSPKDAYLFSTTIKEKTDRMSPGNARRIISHYVDIARKTCCDIPASVHPHMFRRTRATNLYQDSVELELVSAILGHAHLETTKLYSIPSLNQMRDAIESVPIPMPDEKPLWADKEDEMARRCGLR